MNKSGGSKVSQTGGGQSSKGGTKAGSPGRGRAGNGFVGGNWPSTTGERSSGNRGNAVPSGPRK
jgi:hypothetical protein